MGLFDIFKSGPSSSGVVAQVQKAKEVYAQPEYRRMAMEKLLKWGTPESLKGLLERFCVVVQSPHWDEDEKRWLVEELIRIGKDNLPILREFILKKNEVNYALFAFRKIVADDLLYKELLTEALKARRPSDHRSVQGKQELIAAINEFDDEEFIDLLLPYLDDHSDDVQCAAIEVLKKSDKEMVKERLIKLLKSDAHSARVLRAAASIVAEKKFVLPHNAEFVDVVKEDFAIKSGVLVRIAHNE